MKNLSSHFLRALGRLSFRAWKILTRCLDVSIRASAWALVRVLCVAVPLGVLLAIISASSHCYLYFENLAVKEAKAAYVQGVDYLAREHGYVVPVAIVPQTPLTPYQIIKREFVVNGLPNGLAPLFYAICLHESGGGKADAVSPAGALGYCQVTPATGKLHGIKNPVMLFDIETNISVAVRVFAEALQRQRTLIRAMKEYNAGPSRIDATQENRAYPDRVFMELAKLEIEE